MKEALTRSQIGALAEAKIAAEAIALGLEVYWPMQDGARCDLVLIDRAGRTIRVQCKSGRLEGAIIAVRLSTCRCTPAGYLRTTYSVAEIDAIAIYCSGVDRCYALPIAEVAGRSSLHLRLTATRNNQTAGTRMAASYPFGAIAQLGERLSGTQEAAGSSPASSIGKLEELTEAGVELAFRGLLRCDLGRRACVPTPPPAATAPRPRASRGRRSRAPPA